MCSKIDIIFAETNVNSESEPLVSDFPPGRPSQNGQPSHKQEQIISGLGTDFVELLCHFIMRIADQNYALKAVFILVCVSILTIIV